MVIFHDFPIVMSVMSVYQRISHIISPWVLCAGWVSASATQHHRGGHGEGAQGCFGGPILGKHRISYRIICRLCWYLLTIYVVLCGIMWLNVHRWFSIHNWRDTQLWFISTVYSMRHTFIILGILNQPLTPWASWCFFKWCRQCKILEVKESESRDTRVLIRCVE
jgi:hypothetical protein